MDVEDLVKSYFRLGFSNKEILCLLAHQHGVIISDRPILIFITDTDTNYLHVYVPITDMQNRYYLLL